MDCSKGVSTVKIDTMEKNTENKTNVHNDFAPDSSYINEKPMLTTKNDVLQQYKIGKRTKSLWYRCPDQWNADMIQFYTKIRKSKRNYDYKEVLRKSKEKYGSSATDWVLHPFDLCEPQSRNPREKCNVCKQYGHTEYYCRKKLKCIVCIMCGMEGHNLHSCDKKMCLSCGTLQSKFSNICQNCVSDSTAKCDVCNTVGHKSNNCTESWRRFHNTISTEKISEPDEFTLYTPRKDIKVSSSERRPNADKLVSSTSRQYFEARKSPVKQVPESVEFAQLTLIQDIQVNEVNQTRKRKLVAAMPTFDIQGQKRDNCRRRYKQFKSM